MKVSFIGRISTQAVASATKSGTPQAKGSIVENTNSRKNEATQQYESDSSFYSFVGYKHWATKLPTIPKGTLVVMEGELTNVSYKKEDGTNASWLQIWVTNVTPLKGIMSNQDLANASAAAGVAPVATAPAIQAAPTNVPGAVPQFAQVAPAPVVMGTDEGIPNFDFSQAGM